MTGDSMYWRQLGIVAPSALTFPITIIGAGGIGSPTAQLLAKMGCSNITVFDFDSLEEHNLPNQMYRLEDLGRPKVEALADMIRSLTGTEITARNEFFENQSLEGVVIAAVDSMSARQAIWRRVRLNMSVPLYVDGRMGGQIAQVYALNPTLPDKIRLYEGCLFGDEEASEAPCTERAIIYNTFMIASIVGAIIKSFATKQELPLEGVVKLVDMTQLALY